VWQRRGAGSQKKLLHFEWQHTGIDGVAGRKGCWLFSLAAMCDWHKSFTKDFDYDFDGDRLAYELGACGTEVRHFEASEYGYQENREGGYWRAGEPDAKPPMTPVAPANLHRPRGRYGGSERKWTIQEFEQPEDGSEVPLRVRREEDCRLEGGGRRITRATTALLQ
jgi:hypothetical protein